MQTKNNTYQGNRVQSGNILLIILMAIVLIGALTVAIQGTGQQNATVNKETLMLRVSEVQRYASEIERGVTYALNNGKSETDIRFSHPNANSDYGDLSADSDQTDQVFAKDGGGANYRTPPADINDSSKWEFYGNTALPDVGSSAPELLAVLPNVTLAFCQAINKTIGYDASVQPLDTATCLHEGASNRFDDGTQYASSPNTVSDVTFTHKPSKQGCALCDDGNYHFFHVLLAR